MVGGQDELVFDGDSMVVASDGTLLARAGQFNEELLLIDLELPAATEAPAPETAAGMRIERALEMPAAYDVGGIRKDEGRLCAFLPSGEKAARVVEMQVR